MKLQRYNPSLRSGVQDGHQAEAVFVEVGMDQAEDGKWVKHKDAAQLQARITKLLTRNEEMYDKLAAGGCTLGVGDGGGNLFVRGDYDSVKAAQDKLLELESLRVVNRDLETKLKRQGSYIDTLSKKSNRLQVQCDDLLMRIRKAAAAYDHVDI